jgi:hypothetical protein
MSESKTITTEEALDAVLHIQQQQLAAASPTPSGAESTLSGNDGDAESTLNKWRENLSEDGRETRTAADCT